MTGFLRTFGLLVVAIMACWFFGCGSTSALFDDDDDDDDDSSVAVDDDDDISDPEITASVQLSDPLPHNPLAQCLLVTTDVPCSLSGYVTTEGETGYGPSSPDKSTKGIEHEFCFYGLLGATKFDYAIHPVDDADTILAQGSFETSILPPTVPVIEDLEFTPDDGFSDWYSVWQNERVPNNYYALALYDRQGRLRYFRERPEGNFHSILPNGDFVLTTVSELFKVGLDGKIETIFEVALNPPYERKTHHVFYIQDPSQGAIVIFNRPGPGLECDFVTPTENTIGDGIAVVDANGVPIWTWEAFDHQDAIPPDAMNPEHCALNTWGPGTYDWTHANSVKPVPGEQAYLVSMRNVLRVLKIAGSDGEVVWQMGPGLDFSWVGNEPVEDQWFRTQHDAKLLTPTRLLLYDNGVCRYGGTCLSGPWSRALELEFDEDEMTVEQIWEYRMPFNRSQGNAERHANGNTLITSGSSVTIVEVLPDAPQDEYIFKMAFTNGQTRALYYPPIWRNGEKE
jgi:Arylsulfotransferase (ASST)